MSRKRILTLILAVLLILSCLFSLSSCSKKEVMSMGEECTVSLYEIEFFMSRMKGELNAYGYDVGSSTWWNTIAGLDGMTNDEFYKIQVLEMVAVYMTAQYIFDEEGLSLGDEDTDKIQETIDKLIDSAGSKNKLNEILSEYGVNTNMLKDIYTGELKLERVKEHLFGNDGLKSENAYGKKQEFLEKNYACFKQIFLASYYYKTVEDKNGDTVYYTDRDAKHIAYDKANGQPKADVYNSDKYETDDFGDTVYYLHEGKIAYDKKNGVTKYATDENGNKIVEYYTSAQKTEIANKAQELANGEKTVEEFESLIKQHSEGEDADKRMYLKIEEGYYEYLDRLSAYLDEIAASLSKMDYGECRVVESGAGYHVIYKYEHEEKAFENKDYKNVFSTFDDDFVNMLFEEKCKAYESMIEIDEDVLEKLPSMKNVGINLLY